jgi:hypothetical protein
MKSDNGIEHDIEIKPTENDESEAYKRSEQQTPLGNLAQLANLPTCQSSFG